MYVIAINETKGAEMDYHGNELKPVTEPQVFDPPQEKLVWDFESCESYAISKKKVLAIFPDKTEYRENEIKPVLATDGTKWNFCANFPEPRRATNLEFSRWLSHGNGQVHTDSDGGNFDTAIIYDDKCDDTPVREGLMARKWGDKEWHVPTIDYLGIKED